MTGRHAPAMAAALLAAGLTPCVASALTVRLMSGSAIGEKLMSVLVAACTASGAVAGGASRGTTMPNPECITTSAPAICSAASEMPQGERAEHGERGQDDRDIDPGAPGLPPPIVGVEMRREACVRGDGTDRVGDRDERRERCDEHAQHASIVAQPAPRRDRRSVSRAAAPALREWMPRRR